MNLSVIIIMTGSGAKELCLRKQGHQVIVHQVEIKVFSQRITVRQDVCTFGSQNAAVFRRAYQILGGWQFKLPV